MKTTQPQPFIFILMPFGTEFDDVYQLGIKAACSEADAYCERVDEQIFEESILERIFHQIDKSDLIVADTSTRNPNVFYEIGYAHALGRRVILIARNVEDIPFDLMHLPHVIYSEGIHYLKTELRKRIRHLLTHPEARAEHGANLLQFYIQGQSVDAGSHVDFDTRAKDYTGEYIDFTIRIDIHNLGDVAFDDKAISIGLVLPGFLDKSDLPTVCLPDHRCMHLLGNPGPIPPLGWAQVRVKTYVSGGPDVRLLKEETGHKGALRVYSAIGARELDFSIAFAVRD